MSLISQRRQNNEIRLSTWTYRNGGSTVSAVISHALDAGGTGLWNCKDSVVSQAPYEQVNGLEPQNLCG